jgi:magnesium-dependent phosphatase 1
VFDIDYTIWPFWVDTHLTPPLKAVKNGSKVQDRYRESFEFYEDVPSILTAVCTDLVLAYTNVNMNC